MSLRLHRSRFALVAVALAAAGALVCGDAAVAQQPQTPTELWDEYPLNPEHEPSQPVDDPPQLPDSNGDDGPALGKESNTAGTNEDAFPLLQVVIALGVLLLGVVWMGVLMRHRLTEGVRARFGAPRNLSQRDRPRPVAGRRPTPDLIKESRRNPQPVPSAAVRKPSEVARESGKPPKPKAPSAAGKKHSTRKPTGAAKPVKPVKPPRPSRPTKPKPPAPKKPVVVHLPTARERSPTSRTGRGAVNEQPTPVAAGVPAERKLTCSIFLWRGVRFAGFFARASAPQGRQWIVERSPRFEWHAGDTPAEAYDAHAILVDALLRAGWRSVGREGVWYRQRFELSVGRSPRDG
jgi:hypothetical protein